MTRREFITLLGGAAARRRGGSVADSCECAAAGDAGGRIPP